VAPTETQGQELGHQSGQIVVACNGRFELTDLEDGFGTPHRGGEPLGNDGIAGPDEAGDIVNTHSMMVEEDTSAHDVEQNVREVVDGCTLIGGLLQPISGINDVDELSASTIHLDRHLIHR
jgi:hypothetical protein